MQQEVRTALPDGTVIQGRYIVEELLGKGGFGAVYLVRDRRVRGNLFALKEAVDPHKRERERFIFEGEVLKRLDHPSLPRVYRTFEDDAHMRAYILMDYIEGSNLEVLRQRQPEKRFELSQVLALMAPIVDAVSYLHRQQPPIIHRDIKPSNIIVPDSGEGTVLVDFGIAKEYDPEATTTAVRRCSPGYGAPEQYSVGTDPRTDIYGLGATIYVLLTGMVPADALYRLTQLGSRGSDPLEPVDQLAPDVPPAVAEVIRHALAIDIDARFATVAEFWEALQDAAGSLPQRPPLTPAELAEANETTAKAPVVRTVRLTPRRRLLTLLLLLLVLLVAFGAAAGFWFIRGGNQTAVRNTPVTTPRHTVVSRPSPTATPTPSPTPSPTPTPSPSPVVASYPRLANLYNGSIHNSLVNEDGTMSLSQIQQSQGSIRGYFSVSGRDLIGSGPFSGSVTTQKKISFIVTSSGVRPLYFEGTIRANGSMDGFYCSLNAANRCDQTVGGYGTWQVFPQSGGSSLRYSPASPLFLDEKRTRARSF